MALIFLAIEKLQIKISRDANSFCQFLLNTLKGTASLKGTAITLPAIILYYITLSGTNRQILTPKRYDEHPRNFYGGVPPDLLFLLSINTITFLLLLEDPTPSARDLETRYAALFGRTQELPLAVLVAIPIAFLIILTAVFIRALERAKQKHGVGQVKKTDVNGDASVISTSCSNTETANQVTTVYTYLLLLKGTSALETNWR